MRRRVTELIALAVLLPIAGLSAQEASEGPPLLEVTAKDYELQTRQTEIPAGWSTVELTNEGQEVHNLEFARFPNDGNYETLRVVLGVRDTLLEKLTAGAIDSAEFAKAFQEAVRRHDAGWISSLENRGGTGIASPGRTVRTTVHLEPGTYLVVSGLRDSTGTSHLQRGMRRKLVVTEDSSGASPPAPDVEIWLADYELEVEGEMTRGRQTVAVHFGERPDEGERPFLNLELMPLDAEASVEDVAEWFETVQAPAPVEFLGGVPAMPAGATAYINVDLAPGRYAWVSDATRTHGMKKVFTVGRAPDPRR